MIFIKTFLVFFFIIGLIVFIHELGHFLSAKFVGIKVEEFAFGFGKKLLSKKYGETVYKLNMLPIGGYVKLFGEEKREDNPRSFSAKSLGVRLFVVSAGVIMNFILAASIFFVMLSMRDFKVMLPKITEYSFVGAEVESYGKPVVTKVTEGTPAAKANFPENVAIWKIGGEHVRSIDHFSSLLEKYEGQEIGIEVMTVEGGFETIEVTPELQKKGKGIRLGVSYLDNTADFYELDYSKTKIVSGALHSLNFLRYNFSGFKELILESFRQKKVTPVAENVTSIVGVADFTLTLVRIGDILELLNWIALINISVATVNIIPIPGLDGGHALFMLIEKIRGKPLDEKYEERFIKIGLGCMFLIGGLVIVKDIIQFDIIERSINLIKGIF